MTSASIAIGISIVSVIVAGISLGWNIYRDVILKAKVKVNFAVKNIITPGVDVSPDYVGISATNHGPGTVIINTVVLRQTSWWRRLFRKQRFAVLTVDWNNPYTSKMPATLEVGQGVDLFVDYDGNCFLKEEFSCLGINDSFGRTHWAPRKPMKKLRKKWHEEHGKDA